MTKHPRAAVSWRPPGGVHFVVRSIARAALLHAVARPLLAQSPSGIGAEDSDREVDHSTDEGDLQGHEKQPRDEAEDARKDAKEKLEHEQARKREEPDHEDGAEHSSVLQTRSVDS